MKKLCVVCVMCLMWVLSSTVNASAAKTFKNTNGSFKKNVDHNYGQSNEGECVLYVRYETEIPWEGCNGAAHTCYQDAINSGYAVGQTPRVGAIVVFKAGTSYPTYGHVGIVKSRSSDDFVVRESNVKAPHVVGERTIQNNDENIKGYIYADGQVELPTTPVQHHKISVLDTRYGSLTFNRNISISWFPANVPCHKANSWHKNNTCSADYGNKDACQKFYSELTSIDYWKYKGDSNWETVFFGDTDDYRELCGY